MLIKKKKKSSIECKKCSVLLEYKYRALNKKFSLILKDIQYASEYSKSSLLYNNENIFTSKDKMLQNFSFCPGIPKDSGIESVTDSEEQTSTAESLSRFNDVNSGDCSPDNFYQLDSISAISMEKDQKFVAMPELINCKDTRLDYANNNTTSLTDCLDNIVKNSSSESLLHDILEGNTANFAEINADSYSVEIKDNIRNSDISSEQNLSGASIINNLSVFDCTISDIQYASEYSKSSLLYNNENIFTSKDKMLQNFSFCPGIPKDSSIESVTDSEEQTSTAESLSRFNDVNSGDCSPDNFYQLDSISAISMEKDQKFVAMPELINCKDTRLDYANNNTTSLTDCLDNIVKYSSSESLLHDISEGNTSNFAEINADSSSIGVEDNIRNSDISSEQNLSGASIINNLSDFDCTISELLTNKTNKTVSQKPKIISDVLLTHQDIFATPIIDENGNSISVLRFNLSDDNFDTSTTEDMIIPMELVNCDDKDVIVANKYSKQSLHIDGKNEDINDEHIIMDTINPIKSINIDDDILNTADDFLQDSYFNNVDDDVNDDPDYIPESEIEDDLNKAKQLSDNLYINEMKSKKESRPEKENVIPVDVKCIQSNTISKKRISRRVTVQSFLECDQPETSTNLKVSKAINPQNINKLVDSESLLKYVDISKANKSPLGEIMSNPEAVTIDHTENTTKVYTCKFCNKKIKHKIIQHYFCKHSNEAEIKEIKKIPPGKRVSGQKLTDLQLKRQRLISRLRSYGSFKNNCKTDDVETLQLPRKLRKNSKPKKLSQYRVCGICQTQILVTSSAKHLKMCTGIKSNLKTTKPTAPVHNLMVGNVLQIATVYLRPFLTKLTYDETGMVATHDPLIVMYGNDEAYKYRHATHHGKQIRAEMRLLADILIMLRKANGEITELSRSLVPKYVETYIDVANHLGNFDPIQKRFLAPATARDVGRLVKQIVEIWISKCIQDDQKDLQSKANDFLCLFQRKYNVMIVKTIGESQTQINLEKGPEKMPSIEDIKCLNKYIITKRDASYKYLHNKQVVELTDIKEYINLHESTLLSILVLNRKRPGELSRLQKISFERRETVSSESSVDFDNMTKIAKKMAQKYSRIVLRGKKNKKLTPVLLDQVMVECVLLLIELRPTFGISEDNPFVFAKPRSSHSVLEEIPYFDASSIITKYTTECGASFPKTLTCTKMRKQIATYGISLNLTEGQIVNLSSFMGHDKDIHVSIYRQPVAIKHIVEVSQYLERAMGEGEDVEDDITTKASLKTVGSCSTSIALDEKHPNINNLDLVDVMEKENILPTHDNISLSYKSRRRRWMPEAKEILLDKFKTSFINGESISGKEILLVLQENPKLFEGRNIADVRSLLQYETRNYQKNKSDSRTATKLKCTKNAKRNRIPTCIYTHFAEFIDEGILPTIEDCIKRYTLSPSLARYNPHQLQELVGKIIQGEEFVDNIS